MKYAILLALLVCAVYSQEEEIEDVEPLIEEAAMLLPVHRYRMGYNAMANQIMPQPPQQAIEYYSRMTDEDFPVDYSLACSNSCGCRTYCVVMWWIPCNCMCPPPCPAPTTAPEIPIGRFPTTEFPVNQPPRLPPRFTTTTQAPRLPPRFTTTQAPRWPQPELINPPSWNRPQPPVWSDPNNPNNFPTHPPQTRAPSTTQAPGIWQPRPPNVWNPNPNPWDPNNPKNHLTHPPTTTTSSPLVWWPQQPQPPQRPQQPQWPQQPQVPQWPAPEPEPEIPWWQQQPQQPIWPPAPEPLPDQNLPWWQQQQPQQPPRLEDIGPCDDTCSCTPCTIIWICPPQCSALCCASRRFGEAENVDMIDGQEEAESNNIAKFQYPDYLKDVFVPGAI